MIRWIGAALAVGLAASAFAQSPAVVGNLEFTSDSDGFHASRVCTTTLPPTSWLRSALAGIATRRAPFAPTM